METPPQNNARSHISNLRDEDLIHRQRQDGLVSQHNVFPVYTPLDQQNKEQIQKLMGELRKQIKFIDDTKWQFEVNSEVNPIDFL